MSHGCIPLHTTRAALLDRATQPYCCVREVRREQQCCYELPRVCVCASPSRERRERGWLERAAAEVAQQQQQLSCSQSNLKPAAAATTTAAHSAALVTAPLPHSFPTNLSAASPLPISLALRLSCPVLLTPLLPLSASCCTLSVSACPCFALLHCSHGQSKLETPNSNVHLLLLLLYLKPSD